MKRKPIIRFLEVAAVAVFFLGLPSLCHAQAPLTLTLNRLSLDNVNDAAGLWQHEGGTAVCPDGTTEIANYAIHRRVTPSGTSAQNTAMVTLTLFFVGKIPPENITIQGAHDFQSGVYIGSVSAASAAFAKARNKSVVGQAGVTGTVTIAKLGSARVNPCP